MPEIEFSQGQHVVVKSHENGIAHGTVKQIDGTKAEVEIVEGARRGYVVSANLPYDLCSYNDPTAITWLVERSTVMARTAQAPLAEELARQGLIPKSFDDTLDKIFGLAKKARLHDHAGKNDATTDIDPAELPVVVDIVRHDLTIYPDAWVFSHGNGQFDVHIEPGLYYTFYT
jgi:hypothetical protein